MGEVQCNPKNILLGNEPIEKTSVDLFRIVLISIYLHLSYKNWKVFKELMNFNYTAPSFSYLRQQT